VSFEYIVSGVFSSEKFEDVDETAILAGEELATI
jgi:hypothetical protein